MLCHYAWQYVGDSEIARDIVQDVFASAHQLRYKFLPETSENHIKNYFFLAVRNSCLNVLRKKKTEERYWEKTVFNETIDNSTEIRIIRSEVMNAILTVIETLPSSCQLIFKKTYLEGLSNAEVAKELNLSINTVKTQKQRGLKMLKSRLSPDLLIWAAILLDL